MNDVILYTTDDGKVHLNLRAEGNTVWLSQREMAQLFDVSQDSIGLHLSNIYTDEELSRSATTEESSVVQIEGTREVRRTLTLYSLEAILAVGYRVHSPRGAQFRRWATTILKDYLVKGFTMDDERLKGSGGGNYWKELLDRIRDIRSRVKKYFTGKCWTCTQPARIMSLKVILP